MVRKYVRTAPSPTENAQALRMADTPKRYRSRAASLQRHCPFPSDYNRTDERSYERYRHLALDALMKWHGDSFAHCNAVVDECIAAHERLIGMGNQCTPSS
ncbi:hypothetical protein [Aureliella helgolandensis]|uniref:Uncharacterized protein n=1 Tax=Aureliella helgolandensis TaxID=2527968 RepID=A0A518GED5_9BACT|nr:hypothetical protein [Aureliella helgolandensis]QDV26908.1 hypothetical protein Q31a_52880 [Aureliella helgolandensis]